MKEPLWIISNVCLIHTFINFPVFPQNNAQVGNSFKMIVSMWPFTVYNADFSLAAAQFIALGEILRHG